MIEDILPLCHQKFKHMETATLSVTKPVRERVESNSDAEDNAALLELAKSRRNGEFISSEEFRKFLRKLISEEYSSKENL